MATAISTRAPLAIHGGRPVRETLLAYGHQVIDEADIQAVVEVLRSDWLTTGPKVGEFEDPLLTVAGLTRVGDHGALRNPVRVHLVQAVAAGRIANGVGGVSREAMGCGVGGADSGRRGR